MKVLNVSMYEMVLDDSNVLQYVRSNEFRYYAPVNFCDEYVGCVKTTLSPVDKINTGYVVGNHPVFRSKDGFSVSPFTIQSIDDIAKEDIEVLPNHLKFSNDVKEGPEPDLARPETLERVFDSIKPFIHDCFGKTENNNEK